MVNKMNIVSAIVSRVDVSPYSSEIQYSNSKSMSKKLSKNESILPKVTILYKLSKNKKHIKIMNSKFFLKNLCQESFTDSEDTEANLIVIFRY